MVALFGGVGKKAEINYTGKPRPVFSLKSPSSIWCCLEADASSRHTAISRKVVGKMCTRESRKVTCIGYDKYTVTDTAAVEPTFVVFL